MRLRAFHNPEWEERALAGKGTRTGNRTPPRPGQHSEGTSPTAPNAAGSLGSTGESCSLIVRDPAARPIPAEAREGLMRVWLELLREKHPGVTWVPVERNPTPDAAARTDIAAAEVGTPCA